MYAGEKFSKALLDIVALALWDGQGNVFLFTFVTDWKDYINLLLLGQRFSWGFFLY